MKHSQTVNLSSFIMSVQEFNVSVPMLEWIAQGQGSSVEELADTLAPKKRDKFLQGIINKTQAEKLTKLGKIPFGFLFLQKPPVITKPSLPDFRNTLDSVPLSDDFFETFEDVEQKLDWYHNYLKRNDLKEKLPFVGKFDWQKTSVEQVATDIRNTLNLDDINLAKVNKDNYLKQLIESVEAIGILVFKNGVVINNTRRSLNIDEFRGFAITDVYTPAIFLNGNDAPSAQVFTLIHEVAHIWVGEEGVSNWAYPFENQVEAYCNKVASEVLMPTTAFNEFWIKANDDKTNVENLASYFKTSQLSIAIKANQLGLVDSQFVNQTRNELNTYLLKQKASKDGGGSYHNSIPTRNSKRLTQVIVRDTLNQHTLLQDASRLLHTQPNVIMTVLSKAV
jgi:Zn-dependent peptidase ImmA (M78 family)